MFFAFNTRNRKQKMENEILNESDIFSEVNDQQISTKEVLNECNNTMTEELNYRQFLRILPGKR